MNSVTGGSLPKRGGPGFFLVACVLSCLVATGCRRLRPVEERVLRVSAGGDLQLGSHSPPGLPAALGLLLQGDVRFVNLEGPLTLRTAEAGLDSQGTPLDEEQVRFAANPLWAEQLHGTLNLLSLANNHALDAGPEGRSDTASALERSGMGGAWEAQPAALDVHGVRVTLVAAEVRTGEEAQHTRALVEEITRARRSGPVLVSLHWGVEGRLTPTPEQRTLAHALAMAGASAVLGHGPHVVQGVERFGGSVIAYSLGNLAFSCRCTREEDAALVRLAIRPDGTVKDVEVVPLRAGLQRVPSVNPDPELAALLMELSADLGTQLEPGRGELREKHPR